MVRFGQVRAPYGAENRVIAIPHQRKTNARQINKIICKASQRILYINMSGWIGGEKLSTKKNKLVEWKQLLFLTKKILILHEF